MHAAPPAQDIGGNDIQKQEIREAVELPLTQHELYKQIGIDPPRGVLLWGPPGTGKTMLAKAVAHHTTAAFIRVVGSEFVQKYLGEVRGGSCRPAGFWQGLLLWPSRSMRAVFRLLCDRKAGGVLLRWAHTHAHASPAAVLNLRGVMNLPVVGAHLRGRHEYPPQSRLSADGLTSLKPSLFQ